MTGLKPATRCLFVLGEEVLVRVCRKVGRCARFAAQRLAVANLLQVVESAGDAFVAVAVEGVEVDAGSAIHTAV